MQAINSVESSKLLKYSLSSIRVPPESKNRWSLSVSMILLARWRRWFNKLCFSRQWVFFNIMVFITIIHKPKTHKNCFYFKGTVKVSKMQSHLFCFCVQTDRTLRSFKLLWFVYSPFDSGYKQVRFRASRNLSSELTALATWNSSEEVSKSVSKYISLSQINLIFITYTKYKFIKIENCSNCGKVRWQG